MHKAFLVNQLLNSYRLQDRSAINFYSLYSYKYESVQYKTENQT